MTIPPEHESDAAPYDQRDVGPPRGPRISVWHLGALSIAWAAVALGLLLWVRRTSGGELRDELRRWQFWALELQFVLLAATSWATVARLVRSLGVRPRHWIAPVSAAALALVLTTLVAPRTNRIYYDEQIYQSIGQNLSDLRLAQMCNDGTVEYGSLQCWRGEYNKEPYGYPYLLGVAYQVFGVHDAVAFGINAAACALMVILVFLATLALTDRMAAASFASIVAALIPEQLRWSHTAAAEPTAALACLLAVVAALAFVRMRSTRALLWTVCAAAFALQFRMECVLVVPLIVVVIAAMAPREFARPRIWWAGLGGMVLLTVHVGHLAAVQQEAWGTAGPRISLAFLPLNLRANGWFYLADYRFPALYTVLALVGLVMWRGRRQVLVPALYFLLFSGMYCVFYAGSYNYGADDRFSLLTYPPMAMAAGIGLAWLTGLSRAPSSASRVAIAALCFQFLCYLPLVRTTGEEAWGARADVDFAHRMVKQLPHNSVVLTHNPNMFQLWGQSAAQASIATMEPDYVERVLVPRYAGGIFFHWNFWCNVADPVQQGFCKSVLDRFPHDVVWESRERDYRYAIYRLTPLQPPDSRHP